MVKKFLISVLLISGISAFAQQAFTVTKSGFSFSPASISAKVGDKVTFSVGTAHPVLQVEESTYNSNGNTPLSGGFSFPSGSGTYTTADPGTIYYICVNHISLGMKGKIEVSEPTNIPKEFANAGFDVCPNPVDNVIFIKNPDSSNPLSLKIYDISGKTILTADAKNLILNKNSVSLKSLRKGMYFITVIYPDKSFTRKLIKL